MESVTKNLQKAIDQIPFYEYQRTYLADHSRFKAACITRQGGKTMMSTAETVFDSALKDLSKKKTKWVILSRGERQARMALEDGIKLHIEAIKAKFRQFDAEYVTYDNASEVRFENGSKIIALPANPDTARGYSANVLLDEFALHKDSRKIWQAIFPVISRGNYKMRVISTPRGKGNKFYDIMTARELDGVWSRHWVNIYDAVKGGLTHNIEELKAGLSDPDAFAVEYELQWLDEAENWLSYDLINSVEHEDAGTHEGYAGGHCYLGVDIGRKNDLFVIVVLERVGDVLWTRDIIAKQRISFAEQDALLAYVFSKYNVVHCCMDETGMGAKPVEDAQRVHGAYRVEGVMFTLDSKQDMVVRAKQTFQDRGIRIPMGDVNLRNDLHSIKQEVTTHGNVRFVADRNLNGHADRAWAYFLAIRAAKTLGGKLIIASARPRVSNKILEGYL